MKNFCLTLTALLGLSSMISAAPLYILYDESCMDRLEYVQENTDNDEPYIVYQVNTTSGEKIILEVGTESSNPQDYEPSLVYNCGNAVFDQKLVNAINSKIDQAFMVVKKGRRYFVSPINFAALYIHTEDVIFYDSPKYRFQFDRKNGAVGENIAYKSPKAELTFEGAMDRQCTSTYIFRQYSEFSGNPYTDILIVPEIGVVEERSGINIEDALNNSMKLAEVNGKDLERYVSQLCRDGEAVQQGATMEEFTARTVPQEFYNNDQGNTPQSYNNEANTSTRINPVADNALQARSPVAEAAAGTHKVKKGETLYRIAKNNNTTVAALKAANNKSTNTIYPGEVLQLPGATPVEPAAYDSGTLTARAPNADGTYTVQRGDNLNVIADRFGITAQAIMAANQMTTTTLYKDQVLNIPSLQSRSGAMTASSSVPQSYSQTVAAPANATEEKLHRVRAGETVASIALKYGYTEQKLRSINNMGNNQVAKIGQLIKVSDCDCPDTQTANQLQARSPYTQAQPSAAQPATPQSYSNVPAYRRDMMPENTRTSQSGELSEGDGFGQENYSDDRRYYNTPDFTGRAQSADTQRYGTRQPTTPAQPGQTYPATRDELTPRSPYQPQSYNSSYTGRINNQQQPAVNRSRSVYVVKDGDTLFSIARKYGTTVQQLRDVNNLARGEVLIPYQKIYLN